MEAITPNTESFESESDLPRARHAPILLKPPDPTLRTMLRVKSDWLDVRRR